MDKFKDTSTCKILMKDLHYIYRRINHALDNYGMDMDDTMRESLENLYKSVEKVLKQIN